VRAQNVVCMFDGADDEDVLAHEGKVPQSLERAIARSPPSIKRLSPDVAHLSRRSDGGRQPHGGSRRVADDALEQTRVARDAASRVAAETDVAEPAVEESRQ
jgi:hypothetical protein